MNDFTAGQKSQATQSLGMPQMNVHAGWECVGCVGCAACTACLPTGFLIGYASALTFNSVLN